ncbi:MAG TPA: glycosyltransferase family 9 protein [Victivallales bacterium]|nr:glycosyltransferase family 9 protein [Victivallales bacterium]HRR28987.1 glycosyltransferase family 9 protein [Victivallales bacterium]
MKIKRILYCHRGALGDFILSWYGLKLLKEKFLCEFTGLGRPEYLRLAKEFNLCDRILDCESAIFLDFFQGKRLPELLTGFDAAILWLNKGEEISSLLSVNCPKVLTIKPFTGHTHIGIRYFTEISNFFLEKELNINSFFSPRIAYGKKPVLIHPGSGSLKKNLPTKFYLDLSEKILGKGFECKFLFGNIEKENGIFKDFPPDKSIFPSNCIELKETLLLASAFIGNDSGPGHLAAFCGVPVFTIFRDTDARLWHPLGNYVSYSYAHNLSALSDKIISFVYEINY